MKDALIMGITIVAGVVIFLIGLTLGVNLSQSVTKNDCRDYGKHALGDYMLICEKKASP